MSITFVLLLFSHFASLACFQISVRVVLLTLRTETETERLSYYSIVYVLQPMTTETKENQIGKTQQISDVCLCWSRWVVKIYTTNYNDKTIRFQITHKWRIQNLLVKLLLFSSCIVCMKYLNSCWFIAYTIVNM